MSSSYEIVPPAKTLINAIRSIGYNFSTAVADIIDNSVSAMASEIDVYSDPLENEPYFAVLDNGQGMNNNELKNAMTFGSSRSDKLDAYVDLGRFGLGLKSASLSQCRKLIVVSKKKDSVSAMSYDLDLIEKTNKWILNELSYEEIKNQIYFSELLKYDSGTLVIWKDFDKIRENASNFEDSFRSLISDAKKHVELVFHRFYEKIRISFNSKSIDKRDPFLLSSLKSQTGRLSKIHVKSSSIIVSPHVLPPVNSLNMEEKALLGNPKSLHDEQGFYIYREKRLITWGSWLRMGYKSELNKLARIQIDIPRTLDYMWMLDVKKSTVKIPDVIKEQIRAAIDDTIFKSHKVNRFKGFREAQERAPIWERIPVRDGVVRYEINRENPFYTVLCSMIGEKEKKLLNEFISQLEAFIPQGRIINDKYDSINIENTGEDFEVEHLIDNAVELLSLYPEYDREKQLKIMLNSEGFKKLVGQEKEVVRRLNKNDN